MLATRFDYFAGLKHEWTLCIHERRSSSIHYMYTIIMYLHYYVDVHVQLFCMNQHIHMPCIILVAREEIANNFPLAKLVSLYDRQAYSDIPSHRCIFVLSKRVYFIFCFFVCGILNSRPFIRATIFSSIVQPATRHDCKMKTLLLLKF